MKINTIENSDQKFCGECGAELTNEDGYERICCGNCDDTFFADDEIICCDDELPRGEDNPISAQQAPHYCSEKCYKEHSEERTAEYKYMDKKKD